MGHVRAYESVELVSSCMGHEASQDQQNIIGYSGETKMGRKDRRHVRALENEN